MRLIPLPAARAATALVGAAVVTAGVLVTPSGASASDDAGLVTLTTGPLEIRTELRLRTGDVLSEAAAVDVTPAG